MQVDFLCSQNKECLASLIKDQEQKDRINLDYCQNDYSRMLKLENEHSISREDFETSKYNLINAIAELNNTKLNIKCSSFFAPFNGTVTKIVNSDGSAVGSGNEVLDITANSKGVNS